MSYYDTKKEIKMEIPFKLMVGSTVILIVQGVILLLPDRLWIPLEVEMFMTHAILYRKDIKKVLSLAKKLLIPTGGGYTSNRFPSFLCHDKACICTASC